MLIFQQNFWDVDDDNKKKKTTKKTPNVAVIQITTVDFKGEHQTSGAWPYSQYRYELEYGWWSTSKLKTKYQFSQKCIL